MFLAAIVNILKYKSSSSCYVLEIGVYYKRNELGIFLIRMISFMLTAKSSNSLFKNKIVEQ